MKKYEIKAKNETIANFIKSQLKLIVSKDEENPLYAKWEAQYEMFLEENYCLFTIECSETLINRLMNKFVGLENDYQIIYLKEYL